MTDDVMQWMERIQNSAQPDPPSPKEEPKEELKEREVKVKSKKLKNRNRENLVDDIWLESPYDKYTRKFNEYTARYKRAAPPKENKRNTCSLFIQTDPLIWRHIAETVSALVTTSGFILPP